MHLVLKSEVAARKTEALATQATQTGALIAPVGLDTYTAWIGGETFVESACHVLDVVSSC